MTLESDSGKSSALSLPETVAPDSGSTPSLNAGPLEPGQRWHTYQIGDLIAEGRVRAFKAVNVGMLEDVVLEVRPVDDSEAARATTWARWQELKLAGLQQTVEVVSENGWRYEAFYPPPPTTLREWLATHRPDLADIQMLVRQCAATIKALHGRGVGHFNLSPDTIHLHAAEAGLQVVIAGLEQSTLIDQKQLVPLHVDPFYAPPEAAGLTRHSAGATLEAWDWWSLGRVAQEALLGRHAVGLVMDCDAKTRTPEMDTRAVELLMESDQTGLRAGAVERMPPMSDALATLVRGLLTTVREARWGAAEIERWMHGEEVGERYNLPRGSRLFRSQRRTFTVGEAADFFSGAEGWREGVEHIFALKDATRLVHFLGNEPVYANLRAQLDELREFLQLPVWRELPIETVRLAIAAISWLQLADPGRRLHLRGRIVNADTMRAILAAEPAAEGIALARAATAAPFVQLVGTRDPESARLLGLLGAQAEEALALGEKLECLSGNAEPSLVAVFSAALETDARLAEARAALGKQYACTRHAGLQAIFQSAHPARKEAILLAALARDPDRYRFVTHQEWNHERYIALRERGGQLAGKLFWLTLERALRAGALVFGPWPWVVGVWLAVAAAIAVLGTQPWASLVGVAVAGALLGLRAVVCGWQRRGVAAFAQGAAAWTLKSGARRCREELATMLPAETATAGALREELARINREILSLEFDSPPVAVTPPSRAGSTWAAGVLGWSVAGAALGWSVFAWVARPAHEVGAPAAAAEKAGDAAAPKSADAASPEDAGEGAGRTAGATEKKAEPAPRKRPPSTLTPEQRFFTDEREELEAFSFREPAVAAKLAVIGEVVPTPEQVATAVVDGHRLLLPYAQGTARGVIAIPVLVDGRPGLVLFDAQKRQVIERRVFKVAELPPEARSWYELNQRKVLFLGQAPVLETAPVVAPYTGERIPLP